MLAFLFGGRKMTEKQKLRTIRVDRSLTQWDVGIGSLISQPRISLLERGFVSPTADEKQRIAQVLGVTVDQILWPAVVTEGGVR